MENNQDLNPEELQDNSEQNNNNETGQNKVKRFFALTNAALANTTSVIILSVIILAIGVSSYNSMPKENYPEINIPTVMIQVPYPGNSPLDMENLVTRYIEQEVNTVTGVKKITSSSIQDFAMITAAFDISKNADEALQEVKDAVDRAKTDLPNDLPAEPTIAKMDFSEMPVVNVNISGPFKQDVLKEHAEYLQDEIEKFSEISGVDLRGVQEKEVSINVDFKKMETLEINFGNIENAIAGENVAMSGGDVISGDIRRNIKISGEFENIREIEDVIVKSENGNIVYLKDIAIVNFDYEERKSYARSKLEPILTLDIKKRSGQNLLNAVDKLKALIEKTKAERFPKELSVEITNDTSKMTRSMLSNLNNSIISGVILVVLVLLFFLGLRNAMFVGIAIPLSMLMGIGLLNIAGISLNMMVLFSLVLALGMLVDNGIVVVENIYRLMDEEGYSPLQAAKEGVGEVAWPIIVSTLTTIAAFSPLLFWDDMMGEFFKYMPLTLIMVLSSSLFVALVINPVLTSMYMKVEDQNEKTKWIQFIASVVILGVVGYVLRMNDLKLLGGLLISLAGIIVLNKFLLTPLSRLFRNYVLPFLEKIYQYILRAAIWGPVPIFIILGTMGLFGASMNFYFGSSPKVDLFPENIPNYINIFIEKPVGTDIESTNETVLEIEQDLKELLKDYAIIIDSDLAQVGAGTSDPNAGPEASSGDSPHKARINVTFLEFHERQGINTEDVLTMLRKELVSYPGVSITIDKDVAGPPVGKDVNIEISGEDYEELIKLVDEMRAYLNDFDVPGVEGLKTDLETGKPEIVINLDRDKLRRYGLSTGQIAGNIRTSVFGKEISKLKDGEDDYPIWLRFDNKDRYNIESILNQKITFRNNKGRMVQLPISTVANKEYSSTYGSVKRKDLKRVITIYSNVLGGFDIPKINQKYKDYLAAYEMPDGFEYKFTGQEQESNESSAFLIRAFYIAMGLIFLLLVTQFNSIISPFIILITVMMSLIGVFFGYGIFDMPFIIMMTGIGIISLAGIVVNNGIVLIDYINLARQRRKAEYDIDEQHKLASYDVKDTIVKAGGLRLRPVLLTAITTVLGLIPLAMGINIDFPSLIADLDPKFYIGGDNTIFYGPMAWAVIFGLVFATFLTLVVVPVLYYSFDRILFAVGWLGNKLFKRPLSVYYHNEEIKKFNWLKY